MITAARFGAFVLPALALAISACGTAPSQSGNDAESFADRIGTGDATPGAGTPAPAGTTTPQIAETLPGAAPGPFSRGTLTDPADQPTRAEIARKLGRTDNLRFVAYGSIGNVNPDPTNPRLSIMLDAQNIIRDARCG
jgi:hypothetical protein